MTEYTRKKYGAWYDVILEDYVEYEESLRRIYINQSLKNHATKAIIKSRKALRTGTCDEWTFRGAVETLLYRLQHEPANIRCLTVDYEKGLREILRDNIGHLSPWR